MYNRFEQCEVFSFGLFVAVVVMMFVSVACFVALAPSAASYGVGRATPDLQVLAGQADAAADLFLEASRRAPSVTDSVQELDGADAASLQALQATASQQDRQRLDDEMSAGGRCPLCTREYSKLCPESWADVGSGVCAASPIYGGACPAYGSFSLMSASDKQEFERRCSVCWPCSSRVADSIRDGPALPTATAATGFLRSARGAAVQSATVRLVEPDSVVPNAVRDLQSALADALQAVEARQRVDESAYKSLLASSGAFSHAAKASD